jgi:hypothetical protein
MPIIPLAGPVAAALILGPALVLAALALMADAPGEWGRGALIAWTAVAAALLAGAALQAGAGLAAALAILLGFAAIMVGGPPGLLLAATAALLLAALPGLPAPRWLPAALAAPALLVALRHYLL